MTYEVNPQDVKKEIEARKSAWETLLNDFISDPENNPAPTNADAQELSEVAEKLEIALNLFSEYTSQSDMSRLVWLARTQYHISPKSFEKFARKDLNPNKPYIINECGRCGGTGQYHTFGICFECGGQPGYKS